MIYINSLVSENSDPIACMNGKNAIQITWTSRVCNACHFFWRHSWVPAVILLLDVLAVDWLQKISWGNRKYLVFMFGLFLIRDKLHFDTSTWNFLFVILTSHLNTCVHIVIATCMKQVHRPVTSWSNNILPCGENLTHDMTFDIIGLGYHGDAEPVRLSPTSF